MVISQDIPSFVDDDSRSHAVKNVVMSAASRRSWTRLILLFALNAHDRLADLVYDVYETRSFRARPTLLRRLLLGAYRRTTRDAEQKESGAENAHPLCLCQ